MSAACVYRAFDANDRLLYVGCTNNVDQRMAQHAKTAAWFVFHSRLAVVGYETQAEAEGAEANAINNEHPRWNVVGRSSAHPGGPAGRHFNAELEYEKDLANRHRRLVAKEASLLRDIRATRLALAGANAEVAAVVAGLNVDLDVA